MLQKRERQGLRNLDADDVCVSEHLSKNIIFDFVGNASVKLQQKLALQNLVKRGRI